MKDLLQTRGASTIFLTLLVSIAIWIASQMIGAFARLCVYAYEHPAGGYVFITLAAAFVVYCAIDSFADMMGIKDELE